MAHNFDDESRLTEYSFQKRIIDRTNKRETIYNEEDSPYRDPTQQEAGIRDLLERIVEEHKRRLAAAEAAIEAGLPLTSQDAEALRAAWMARRVTAVGDAFNPYASLQAAPTTPRDGLGPQAASVDPFSFLRRPLVDDLVSQPKAAPSVPTNRAASAATSTWDEFIARGGLRPRGQALAAPTSRALAGEAASPTERIFLKNREPKYLDEKLPESLRIIRSRHRE